MAKYKNILSGYINEKKNGGGHYLAITNLDDKPVVIEPGGKIFLNRTPKETLDRYPKIPHYSKSIKIEDDEKTTQPSLADSVADDIPF